MQVGFEQLAAEVRSIKAATHVGRIAEIGKGTITVCGLSGVAAQGDLVEIGADPADRQLGEVLTLSSETVTILPDDDIEGLQIGDPVRLSGQAVLAPDKSWMGRVIDPMGRALDGRAILRGKESLPIRAKAPNPTERNPLGARLETGLAAFNTFLPIVQGQRIGLFAGSGVGKSTLLARLARGVQADVVVIALIGERGREVREFVDRVMGPVGMKKTIVVAATSDQSPMMRRRCGWAAMTVAEYFSRQGQNVLFLADSVTRYAEAHREIALAAGETGSLRGFPASTVHQITTLCERAGPGIGDDGDITAVFSVLVAGSDMEEPVADMVRGVLDGHVVLDRNIAERGRFPAIDLLRSVSRALPEAATETENNLIAQGRRLLGSYSKSELMIQSGLYNAGSDPVLDEAIRIWPNLDTFLSETEPHGTQESFQRLAEIVQ